MNREMTRKHHIDRRSDDVNRVFGDRTYRDIDDEYGLSAGTTKKRLLRGWKPEECLRGKST